MVQAGTANKIPFLVPKNNAIAWKVMVKSFDIGFAVKLRIQELGGAVEQDLEPPARIEATNILTGGRRAVAFDRYILLEFDNTYSRFRSKTVAYQLLKGSNAEALLQQIQEQALALPRPMASVTLAKSPAEEAAAAAAAATASVSATDDSSPADASSSLLESGPPTKISNQTAESSSTGLGSDDILAGGDDILPSAPAPGWANVWTSLVSTAQTATVVLASKAKSATEGTALEGHASNVLQFIEVSCGGSGQVLFLYGVNSYSTISRAAPAYSTD